MYTTGAFLEADVQANLCGLACTHEGQAPPPLSFHSSFFSQLFLFTTLTFHSTSSSLPLPLLLFPCYPVAYKKGHHTLYDIAVGPTPTTASALRQRKAPPQVQLLLVKQAGQDAAQAGGTYLPAKAIVLEPKGPWISPDHVDNS